MDDDDDVMLQEWLPDDSDDEKSAEPTKIANTFKVPERTIDELKQTYSDTLKLMSGVCYHTSNTENFKVDGEPILQRMRDGERFIKSSVDISRVPATIPKAEFDEKYCGNGGKPCVIEKLPEHMGWRATERWASEENLMKYYGHVPLKITEIASPFGMGHPYEVRLPLCMFKEYCDTNSADNPFYAFEYDFNDARSCILQDWKTPSYWQEDVYNLTARTRHFYPNWKHLIVGGPRTGTNLHFDPKGTCAWNTCTLGRKKWVFFSSRL